MSDRTLHKEHDDELDNTHATDMDQPSVLTLIRSIQSGALDPKNLATQDRRACVEHLTGEGYSAFEIGEILKVSDRTISRDRNANQEANAIKKDPELVERMSGRLVREAELAISRIRRVTRDKQVSAGVRVDGERSCWRILLELVQGLQGLGYLPTAAQHLKADLTHHLSMPQDAESIQVELQRICEIQQACGPDDDAMSRQSAQVDQKVRKLLEGAEIKDDDEHETPA